jgi:hypothetical protein
MVRLAHHERLELPLVPSRDSGRALSFEGFAEPALSKVEGFKPFVFAKRERDCERQSDRPRISETLLEMDFKRPAIRLSNKKIEYHCYKFFLYEREP